MSAYHQRLHSVRIGWTALILVFWGLSFCMIGFTSDMVDVTIFFAVMWALGFPRNVAKRVARREARHREFLEAVDEESRR